MINKQFSERLNHELDEIGLPQRQDERVEAFAKLMHTPRFTAESILNGITIPDEPLLTLLAQELEVNTNWLLGKQDEK